MTIDLMFYCLFLRKYKYFAKHYSKTKKFSKNGTN